ncbi:pentatricopeptide repeat-containing protein [Striga asiatica]|uniref:Pentatricopeptide repeat-containing protein n=1 Tax=Striga asiatica TaxID=4170 RepID=A0A5A7QTH4_STRAF|nr:pentatricopeptide repeat-containing protein [Striga asiatica]
MALITSVRRLHRLYLRFPHSSPSLIFIPSTPLPFPATHLSRAFHRTPHRPVEHAPHFENSYQIVDFSKQLDEIKQETQLELRGILERAEKAKDFASGDEAIAFLDGSGVKPDNDLIFSAIWALRDDWKLAFLAFKWGVKWDCVVQKTWSLMVWLLGNHQKFGTAWTLIHELHRDSKDTQQAMMIMIDRYAAANYLDKAVQTFHLMQKFKFTPEQDTYLTFLNILCKHGNIEEAEQFMYLNKKFFPLDSKGFNVILDGWCNTARDIVEAKRVWREMSKCCVMPDATSYTHMISCYSTARNLFESLRLYDEMKKRGWVPGVNVYHSLIYVLTRENCLNEALKIVDWMKVASFKPNSTTYHLVICALCESLKFEDARNILARMISDDLSPTVETYHALLKGESLEGTLGVLGYMRKAGLGPSKDTFFIVLDKFLKEGQPKNALMIWYEMKEYDVKPECGHYLVLVEGLAKNGLLEKAREIYSEMRCVSTFDDPSLKKLLDEQEVCGGKGKREMTVVRNIKKGKGLRCSRNRISSGARSRKKRPAATRK